MGSGYTLYRIDGVKLSNGQQAYGSREMVAWYPVFLRYMRELQQTNIVPIKVADRTYSAASARTHLGGWACDERTWNLTSTKQRRVIEHGTRLGRPTHKRYKSQGFAEHFHSMLDVGYTTPCSYQIVDTRNGRDGLARRGPDRDRGARPPQPWAKWNVGLALMLKELAAHGKPGASAGAGTSKPAVVNKIPRTYTRKPWVTVPEDGILSGLFLSRIQWQLNVHPTGKLDHYTIRALKVWLGNADDGTGILHPVHIKQLQGRIGVTKDADWGPVTTRAFQRYLNNNR